jgi:hypothetical protein
VGSDAMVRLQNTKEMTMPNLKKQVDRNDENNHHANPPGNPVLEQDVTEMERLMQKKYAAIDNARASQTADVAQHGHPIKQPNKVTNNS